MPALTTAHASAPTSTPTPIAAPASEPAQGPAKAARPRRPVTLELAGAVKRYGEVTALAGVDLALRGGEVTAVLGPNGAGKTTAVGLLAGLLRPTEGRATAFGGDPASPAARCRMGVMLQVSGVPPTLKVGEHLDLFRSYYPDPLPAAEVVRIAGLEGLEDRPYGKLSGGQQQRLLFALALAGNPDVLFLDEPTVGLDVSARRGLWEGVRRLTGEGRTILLTTHYLDEADALADRIVVLDRGRVVADGSPSEVKSRVAARRVRFHSRLPMDTVRALPDVVEARRDGADYQVLARRAEPVVRRLLDLDPDLSALEVTSAGLEEAFLALTRKAGAEPADTKGSSR